MENSACILLAGVDGVLPVKALYDAFLAVLAVLALRCKLGELFVDCRSPLCRGVLRDMVFDVLWMFYGFYIVSD